jgi:hypothetical protein
MAFEARQILEIVTFLPWVVVLALAILSVVRSVVERPDEPAEQPTSQSRAPRRHSEVRGARS